MSRENNNGGVAVAAGVLAGLGLLCVVVSGVLISNIYSGSKSESKSAAKHVAPTKVYVGDVGGDEREDVVLYDGTKSRVFLAEGEEGNTFYREVWGEDPEARSIYSRVSELTGQR